MTTAQIQEWDDGPGLILSNEILDLAKISIGDDVTIVVADRKIMIAKVERSKPSLSEMISRIPHEMRVGEIDFGPPVGRET